MGVLPYSNLSIGGIAQELVNVGSYSLRALSADAGKSTPDGMGEFRGYQLGTATVSLYEPEGSVYDGCSFSVDNFGQFRTTDPEFGYISEFGSARGATYVYNNIQPAGYTFVTDNGAYSSATCHGRYNVTVYCFANTYYRTPCQPMFFYIDLSGVGRVASANVANDYNQLITYSFTAAPGGSYAFTIGIGFGSV
jgi:hypothetical protein